MIVVLGILFLAIAFFIGAIGFPQIVGSLQRIGIWPLSRILLPMLLWTLIIFACGFAVYKFLPDVFVFFCIGLGISFLMTISAGRIV